MAFQYNGRLSINKHQCKSSDWKRAMVGEISIFTIYLKTISFWGAKVG